MAILLLPALTLTAQVTFTTSRMEEKKDRNYFSQTSSKEHPGGWNFDLLGMGLNVKTKKSSSRRYWNDRDFTMFSGWGFGFNTALNAPDNMEVNMGRSFHFCINDVLALRQRVWKYGSLSIGMGIDLKNYRLTGNRFWQNERKEISVIPYPENSIPESSKLRILSTTINVKYIQNLGKRFRLAVGPELFIVPGRAKNRQIITTFADEYGEHKEVCRGIRNEKVGFNLTATLQYKHFIGFYAKYGLTNVLEKNLAPEFQPLSVGITVLGI